MADPAELSAMFRRIVQIHLIALMPVAAIYGYRWRMLPLYMRRQRCVLGCLEPLWCACRTYAPAPIDRHIAKMHYTPIVENQVLIFRKRKMLGGPVSFRHARLDHHGIKCELIELDKCFMVKIITCLDIGELCNVPTWGWASFKCLAKKWSSLVYVSPLQLFNRMVMSILKSSLREHVMAVFLRRCLWTNV